MEVLPSAQSSSENANFIHTKIQILIELFPECTILINAVKPPNSGHSEQWTCLEYRTKPLLPNVSVTVRITFQQQTLLNYGYIFPRPMGVRYSKISLYIFDLLPNTRYYYRKHENMKIFFLIIQQYSTMQFLIIELYTIQKSHSNTYLFLPTLLVRSVTNEG